MFCVNAAVTDMFAVIETVHWLPLVESQPLQPAKVDPAAAAAVSVTEVPSLNCAEQVEPQLTPLGELVTVPEPVPDLETVSVRWGVKVAVTALSAPIATVH